VTYTIYLIVEITSKGVTIKKSSYYYGDLYTPTLMQDMSYPKALQYKIYCGEELLKSLDTPFGKRHKDVSEAIADNKLLLDEVFGLPVEFFEPSERREYIPKDYLTD
jgi:hypothetical protein